MDFKSFFLDYFKRCLNEGIDINIHEMRTMASSNTKAADIAFKELWDEGIITGKPSMNVFEPGTKLDNFDSISLTQKGIEYIKQRSITQNATDYFSNINSAFSAYQNTINQMQLNLQNISNATQLHKLQNSLPRIPNISLDMRDSFTPAQIEQINQTYSNIAKQIKKIYGQKHTKGLQNYLNTVEEAQKSLADLMKEPPSTLYKELTKGSKENPELFTFEGILGQNCGEVVTPTSEDEKRIQEKGFKVENGIKVLRGFANSAILAFASKKDENYQREENIEHLNAIEKFVENMRASAKYLPEVTLIARGYENLERINLSGTLSKTQKGELDNLEYYKLTVSADKLYRIDGNHRLEALKKDNYYIPFSIIIWDESDINSDDEAFLFYFLNSKAKKLTTEENLKGLVNATTWKPHELLEANKYLPHLQYLEEQIKTNKFLSSYFCNNEPIKNIAEVLDKIEGDIELEQFKEILALTNELLICDKWNDLKIFKFYCQLVFYIAFKNQDKSVCISILDNINNWVRKYKFDNTTFNNPIMLYESAEKTNITRPIKVFVAMPYYDDEIIEDFNDQLKKLSEELIKKYPLLENRFEIYEVMKHRGYEIDIQNQIIEQIKSANIFIADVSEHVCKKGNKKVDCHANPNVMYELGIAKGQSHTEIILLKNKKDKIEVPSDIITKYHNKFEFEKKVSMRKKLFEAIENILKDRFNII